MGDKKHIDRIFQERFKDFEVAPPPVAWEKIEKKLHIPSNPKAAIIPLWLRYAGVAAVIAIVITLVNLLGTSTNDYSKDKATEITNRDNATQILHDTVSTHAKQGYDQNHVTTLKTKTGQTTINQQQSINEITPKALSQQNTVNTPTENASYAGANKTPKAASIKSKNLTDGNEASTSNVQTTEETVHAIASTYHGNHAKKQNAESVKKPEIVASQNVDSGLPQNLEKNTNAVNTQNTTVAGTPTNTQAPDPLQIVDLLAAANEKNKLTVVDTASVKKKDLTQVAATTQETIDEEDIENAQSLKNRWSGTPVFAPLLSGTLAGSSLGEDFKDNSKTAGLNLSYGMLVGYQATPKLIIRTGMHQVRIAYNTLGINYEPSAQDLMNESLRFNPQAVSDAGSVADSSPLFQEIVSNGNNFNGLTGNLSQQLEYIEVPVEVRYKLVDRKISLHMTGGMSAFFLTGNNVNVTDGAKRLELGTDSNFNDFHQSINLGLGVGYKFSESLGAMIEPVFKYQINTLKSNVADFRPYNLGLYTGITFTF